MTTNQNKYLNIMAIILLAIAVSSCTSPLEQTDDEIAVIVVSLNQSRLDITEGDKLTIIASVMPSEAMDMKITWSSDNPSVATVVANTEMTARGEIRALKEGTAFITAQAGNQTATCIVTVTKQGVLNSALSELIDVKYEITDLTLTGNLNGDDIRFIREMAGRDVLGNTTAGKLTNLNLDGANIVAGGSYYSYPNLDGVDYTYSFSSDLIFYTQDNVIGEYMFNHCNLKNIILPNSITSIAADAFYYCRDLTNISIPESVTSIGDYVFSGCSGLTSLTIPNSVTSVSNGVFAGCAGLTSFTIPNSVMSIGIYAFSGCTGLTSLTIPNSVTSIASATFYNCTGLTSLTIPNSVTKIGGAYGEDGNYYSGAFTGCTGLTSITIPNSVTTIGDNTFTGCSGLTSITIPNSVTSIGWGAFQGCTGLTSITIGNSITSIDDFVFSDCTGLTSITIPNNITSIGVHAFRNCSGLKSITIPNSVTSVGDGAFRGCLSLTSVTIPKSVTKIGDYVFSGCESLNEIHSKNPTPPAISYGSAFFYMVDKKTCKLYIPKGSMSAYKAAEEWKYFINIIEE